MSVLTSRLVRLAAGLGTGLTLAVAGAGPALAADFGTAPVSGPGSGPAPTSIRDVTVGRHAGYDRVVFTAASGLPRWSVRYVPAVTQDGSGSPVRLDGKAALLVVLQGTDWTQHPSVGPDLLPRFPGLRQVAPAGEFEGVLSYGVGQATKAGFRAFALTGPDRLVVDVAHPAAPGGGAPAGAGPTAAATDQAGATAVPAATEPTAIAPAAAGAGDPPAGGLADTGSDYLLPAALAGGVLLLAGLTALVAFRARRTPAHHT